MSCVKSTAAVVLAVLLGSSLPSLANAQDPAPAAGAEPAPAAAAEPAAAPADPNAIIARVGDATVTEAEVGLAKEAFADELQNVPAERQRSVVVDAVVSMKLLAEAAHEAGLDQGPEFALRLEFLKLQAMRNAYVEHEVVDKLTDESLQQAYQTLVVARHKAEQEVHARHILVDTKEQAEKIIADLKGGASFEELAKQSKDPSGQNGGDLGFFGPGQMVPPFEKAAFALEPGQITQEPVQSEFGWHVIKVEEKRMSQPPSFDEVKDQLRSYVLREDFEKAMAALREKYKVEIVDPTALPQDDDTMDDDGSGVDDEDMMDDGPALEGDEPAIDEPDATGDEMDEDDGGAANEGEVPESEEPSPDTGSGTTQGN